VILEYLNIGFKKLTGKLWVESVIKLVKWNFWIRYVLISYNQLTLAASLQLSNFDTINALSVIGHVFNAVAVTFSVLFPIWCTKIMNWRYQKYDKEAFNERFGTLCEEFKENGTGINQNFMSVILIRKLSFMISMVLLYNFPLLNLSFLMIQNISIICLVAINKPYQRVAFNLKNIVQEVVLLVINIMLVCIYSDYLHVEYSETSGWVMIGFCFFLIAYNFVFLLYDQYCSLKKIYGQVKAKLLEYKRGKAGKNRASRLKLRESRKLKILQNKRRMSVIV